MKPILAVVLAALSLAAAPQQDDPFRVKRAPLLPPGPQITSYLQYQVDQAWRQDQRRAAEFAGIRTEAEDACRVQVERPHSTGGDTCASGAARYPSR